MGFNFPDAPTPGQVYGSYTWDAATGAWKITGGAAGGASVTISDTAPSTPTAGNLWWESDTGFLYIAYKDPDNANAVWVIACPQPDIASAAVAAVATTAVRYDAAQSLTAAQATQARQNVYAAPFDAMAYNGMQINGSCEVSQEFGVGGTSVPLAAAGTGVEKYVMDGWKIVVSGGGTGSNLQCHSTSPSSRPGFSKCFQVYSDTHAFVVTPPDTLNARQLIEASRIWRLGWGTASAQPVTIAFWLNSVGAGQMGITLRNTDVSRNITKSVTTADGWGYYTVTFPGDTAGTWGTANTDKLWLDFCLASGANGIVTPDVWSATIGFASAGQTNFLSAANQAIQLTGVVILPGIEAPSAARSPLIMRPYDQELPMCQRYYRKVMSADGVAYSATQARFNIDNRIMRSPPVVSISGIMSITDVAAANFTQSSANVSSFNIIPEYSGVDLGNFAGLTSMRFYRVLYGGSYGYFILDARL